MKYQLTIFQGGLKNFLIPPKFLVCVFLGGGGLKTETGLLHEILTDIKSQISQQPFILQGKSLHILVDI